MFAADFKACSDVCKEVQVRLRGDDENEQRFLGIRSKKQLDQFQTQVLEERVFDSSTLEALQQGILVLHEGFSLT